LPATPTRRILGDVPFYMDRHDFAGLTAVDAAKMHLKDLEVQGQFGVQFLNYWFDYDRQTAFCLAKAPNGDAVEAVHRQSHGSVPGNVIEVDERAVHRFMGNIVEHPPGEPYVETAFRTILFTDMEGSTSLTQRLGDARSMAVLREHDRIVEEAIGSHGGSKVKHTGDGLMAAFPSVVGAIESAVQIQRRLAEVERSIPVRVRIGMSAGEPVTERNDLFGAVVQLAARLCSRAEPGSVLVSNAIHDLALGKGFVFRKRRSLSLKGFDDRVPIFEVMWQPSLSVETAVAGESRAREAG
jgi:class 3 adenylate cyclase